MTRAKKILRAIDVFLAMLACVALLSYAHSKRFEQHRVSSLDEISRSGRGGGSGYQGNVDAYELMVAYSPNDAAMRRRLGDAYYNHEQMEKAAAAYKEAVRLNPSDLETWMKLGSIYSSMERFTEAQEAFEAAHRLNPNSLYVKEVLENLRKRMLYDRFFSEYANNPRSAYVAATEYLARYGAKDDEYVRYLRFWVDDFEQRVPQQNRPLKNLPGEGAKH